MSEPAVIYEVQDRIGVITLNRPDNRNSMTPDLLEAFVEATGRAAADPDLRCVVITGRGNCFSAGADFKSQIQVPGEDLAGHEKSYQMYVPFLSVLDIEVPVIGALQGHAVGGGFGLALVCDVRVANQGSKYGANFTRIGLSPGMAISYILPRLVGASRAAELLYTGRLMLGDEAAAMGLMSQAVEGDRVFEVAMDMARKIAGNAPMAVKLTKQVFLEGMGWDVREGAMREAIAQAVTVESEDCKEGMAALLGRREPDFKGR